MGRLIDIINLIFKREEKIILDDRFEFRINKDEKILIKKYCDLRKISASEFFRNLAMKEINEFIQVNR